MGKKLGIEQPKVTDKILIENLLKSMQKGKSDFTNTFRKLPHILDKESEGNWFSLFSDPKDTELKNWQKKWKNRVEPNETNKVAIKRRRIPKLCQKLSQIAGNISPKSCGDATFM